MDKRTVVADLGWCMARLVIDGRGKPEQLVIVSPSDTDTVHEPASSIKVYGEAQIFKLKALLNEVQP